ncbi:MAG: DDE-type integrase/transposase/recombinase [Dehalococcoidia bacterium]|nr:DDE-type integrase/transposase/recombinase [Dehalococcoidia bacterium]
MQDTPITDSKVCKNCGSDACVKYGSYKGVQRYYCKSCKSKFKGETTLVHMKTPPEQISGAMSMYYSGMSINEIRSHLKQENGNYPSSKAVYGWIDKYSDLAIKTMRDYHPKVGDKWIADETVLRIDGQNVWMFDIIDEKTRYLLATRMSLARTAHDVQMLMETTSKKAGKTPKVVVTDKLHAYLDGIEIAFGSDTEHIRSSPFALENDTNLIERFHGTLKDRTKVMRGLKNIDTAIQFTDAWLVNYNYFRPHETLKGKSPAEVAGVDYKYKNWAEIIRQPVSKEAEIHSHRTPKISPPKPRIRLPETHIGRPRKRLRISSKMPRITAPMPRLE